MTISRFTMGDYGEVARIARQPDGDLPGVLSRAFGIVHEHATVLDRSLPRPVPFQTFLPEDAALLAIPPAPEYTEERLFDTNLDNALLLLFTVAWNTAEADRPHLLACQVFLRKLLDA
jgi:hypothetical protein